MNKRFWILFSFFIVLSMGFVYRFCDKALPLVHVAITMDSDQAKNEAKKVAEQYQWDICDYQLLTKFDEDSTLQAFVELEGGGKQAFIEMMDKGYYQPYTWRVRFFKEKTIKEFMVVFTPCGQKYEFAMKLPDDQSGAALSKEQALDIACVGAKKWGVDLALYGLIEYQSEVYPSGRIDHAFTYERDDIFLSKGRYRVILKVSGDIFSGLSHCVKVPDEFYRRYEHMFAANKLIAGIAQNCASLFYIFIIGLYGLLFFYQRRNSLLIAYSVKVMIVCAILLGLLSCNKWPLIWQHYPTNVSSSLFVMQKIGSIVFKVALFSILTGLICLVVEAMGRYVFHRHIQFFKNWSFAVVGSYTILEQTLLGYGFAIILLAYMVGFLLFAQYLGWWAPLSTIIDPNILSMRLPFFTPLVTALQAGFFEEVALRALPIAGILLLMRNSKHKTYWLWSMFVFQVVIFGALHANYPQQPAYFRIVEIIFPSSCFGLLYYFFGLLPGIVAHFTYDALLMSLPIFVSTLWLQKVMAIVAMLIPLWIIILGWWLQGKKFIMAPISAYNQAWKFTEPAMQHGVIVREVGSPITRKAICGAWLFGVLGILGWFYSKDFQFQSQKVGISRMQAEDIAQKVIRQNLGALDDSWIVLTLLKNPIDFSGNKFIWQEYGNGDYQRLQGTYVVAPHYLVKYVKFSGPVEERAEKFEVIIGGDGTVLGMRHIFPEFWSGDDLSDHEAEALAYSWIKKIYNLSIDDVEIVSCKSLKYEHRRDWMVTLKDVTYYQLPKGQGRIDVKFAGSQLADIHRYVYEPEQWSRDEKNRLAKDAVLHGVLYVITALLILFFMVTGFLRHGFLLSYLRQIFSMVCIFVVLRICNLVNSFKQVLFDFNTSEPMKYQLVDRISSYCMDYFALGIVFAVLLFFVFLMSKKNVLSKKSLIFLGVLCGTGVVLGCGIYGLLAFLKQFEPQLIARGPEFSFSNYQFPEIGIMIAFFLQVLSAYIILAGLFISAEVVSVRYKSKAWILNPALFVIVGMSLSGAAQLTDVSIWCLSGMVMGLVWYMLYQYFFFKDIDLLLIVLFMMNALFLVPSMVYQAYPGIMSQGLISIVLFGAIVAMVYRKM